MHLFWEALSSRPYWRGALTALALTAPALGTALVIGFFVALGSMSPQRPLRTVAWIYNWLFRATPTLLQLIFIWYVLPTWWSGRPVVATAFVNDALRVSRRAGRS